MEKWLFSLLFLAGCPGRAAESRFSRQVKVRWLPAAH